MVKIGDWVRSYSAGIWQVYKIIEGFYETRSSLDEQKNISPKRIVFSSRICNNKWKKSFSNECCSEGHVKKLTAEEQAQLEEFLSKTAVAKSFHRYNPKPIDYCTVRSYRLPDDYPYDRFSKTCELILSPLLENGAEFDEILNAIENSEISEFQENRHWTNARLMFFSPDHLVKNNELIFTRYEALDF